MHVDGRLAVLVLSKGERELISLDLRQWEEGALVHRKYLSGLA